MQKEADIKTPEQLTSAAHLKDMVKHGSLEEISRAFDLVISEICEENPNSDALTIYRKIVDTVPYHIPQDTTDKAMQALTSTDTNTANLGRKVFTLLHLRTILSAVEPYLGKDKEEDNEIIQTVLTDVSGKLVALSGHQHITIGLFGLVRRAVEKYLASAEGVSFEERSSDESFEDRVVQILYAKQFAKEVLEAYLSPRQAICIMRNFGLGEFVSPQTHGQIAEVFGVSETRIQQIVAKAKKSIKQACFWKESWLAGFGRSEKGLDVRKPYKRSIDYRFNSFDFTESHTGLLTNSSLPNRIVMSCLRHDIISLKDLKTVLASEKDKLWWMSDADTLLIEEYFQMYHHRIS